jgi:hypothetical protein
VEYFEVTNSWIVVEIEDPPKIRKLWNFLPAIDAFVVEINHGFDPWMVPYHYTRWLEMVIDNTP